MKEPLWLYAGGRRQLYAREQIFHSLQALLNNFADIHSLIFLSLLQNRDSPRYEKGE
jgi:hypothetical protein